MASPHCLLYIVHMKNCAEKELLIVLKKSFFVVVQKYYHPATMHSWILVQGHAGGPGSIPGRCNQFCKQTNFMLLVKSIERLLCPLQTSRFVLNLFSCVLTKCSFYRYVRQSKLRLQVLSSTSQGESNSGQQRAVLLSEVFGEIFL